MGSRNGGNCLKARKAAYRVADECRTWFSVLVSAILIVSLSFPSPAAIAYAAASSNSNENTEQTASANANANTVTDDSAANANTNANEVSETSSAAASSASADEGDKADETVVSEASNEETDETDEVVESDEPEKEEAEKKTEEPVYEAGVLSKELKEAGFTVEVKYTADAKIPAGSTLSVAQVKDKEKEKYYSDKLEDALKLEAEEQIAFSALLDITILDESGTEVQPAAPVSVEIRIAEKALPDGISNDEIEESFSVVHFDDKGEPEKIESKVPEEKNAAEEPGVVFETDSFSVFSITSIVRELADWITDYLRVKVYSLLPVNAQLARQSDVSAGEEREVLEAYKVFGGSRFWLKWSFEKNIDLGKYGSLGVYETSNGSLGEEVPDYTLDKSVKYLNLDSADGFALVKDSGLRSQKFEEQPAADQDVEVSGRAPIGASATIVDVTEANRGTYNDLLAAYDVTIVDGNGEGFQPEAGSPMEVAVSNPVISELVGNGGQADVKHVLADGSLEAVESEWDEQTGKLVFEADGFSVYIIIDHEGHSVVTTPRIQFHFLDEEFTDAGGGVYTAGPFNFRNKANPSTYQWTQILTDGEQLEMITNPPNIFVDNGDGTTAEKFFYGWYVVNLDSASGITYANGQWTGNISYTWTDNPEKVVPEVPLSIETTTSPLQVNDTISWSINGASGTGTLDSEGIVHVYLAPIYENYYFVNFRMGALVDSQSALQNELMTRKLAVLGADDSATVRIGDIICQGSDPTHQVFIGWQTEAMSHEQAIEDQYYATVDSAGSEVDHPSGATGYNITLHESDFTNLTYDLYPLFAEARWLYFNTGRSGNGSTYIGATYRLNNDEGAGTYYDTAFFNNNTSTRNGYNMAGWYAFANMDDDTSTITNLNTAENVDVSYVDDNGDVQTVTFNMRAQELVHHNGSYSFVAPANNSNIATATAGGVTYTLKANGGIYYLNFDGADHPLFGVVDNKLYFYRTMDDLTLKANWTMDTETTIRVIVWKQKVSDDKNTTKTPVDLLNWLAEDPTRTAANYPYAVKDYDYEIFYVKGNALTSAVPSMTSFSGYYVDANGTQHNVNNLNLTTLANNTPSYLTDFTGFHYSCNDASIVGRPLPDGSSVYNVYYDRDLRAINFYYYGNNNIPDGAQPAYTYTTTTSSSGTQYGIVNDQYMQLSYSNGQWTAPEYHYVYSQDPDGMFGLVGDKYYPLTKTIDTTTSAWTYTTTDYRFSGKATGTTSGDSIYYLNNGIYYGTNRSTSWFSTTWYLYSYTSTTGHGTNLYGLVEFSDGNQIYVPLTRNGHNNNSYYYTLPGGEVYNGTRYTANASGSQLSGEPTPRYTLDNTGRKTDNVYPDSSPRYTRSNRTFTETSVTTGTLYGLIDASRSIYAQLTRNEVHTYKYTYVDDNGETRDYTGNRYSRSYEPTGNRVEYTATRYTRSNSTLGTSWGLLTWSGLYGQSFGRNGYSWDDVSSHYWREGTSGNSGTGQTFLDAFIQESNPYNLATRTTPGSSVIYHYRQQLDGTYTTDDRETAYASGGSFSFSNKFTGFTVSTYSTGNNGYSPNGGNNAATGSSSSYPLHIYHTRNAYDFTFDVNYPDDATVTFDGLPADDPNVQKSANLTVSPKVLYEGPLASYGSTPTSAGTNWYYGVPNADEGITATNELLAPDHYIFGGWYEDATCTVPFNFNSTMPAANKIVYAKWEPEWFVIRIDPNGAEIDHRSNSSQSTYFWLSYGGTISEYAVDRNYVPMSEEAAATYNGTKYYYMNHQYDAERDGDFGLNANARNAVYLTESEIHDYYTNCYAVYAQQAGVTVLSEDIWRQKYVSRQAYRTCYINETYKFLGWYQVLDEGTENEHLASMPYVFSTPVSEDITLRAMWRLDGGYRIQYHADYYMDDGTYINGTMQDWYDPKSGDANLTYADGAYTTIYKQPFDIMVNGQHSDEYDFRGFRLVTVTGPDANNHITYTPLEHDVYYQPGDDYTIFAANADPHGIIHLQAVYEEIDSSYRRPYVTNLTLDANGGYLVDGSGATLQENTDLTGVSGWYGIGTVAATIEENNVSLDPHAVIEFGDIQSNQAVHLYRYATELETAGGLDDGAPLNPTGTNYFAHPENYFLLGFDGELEPEPDYIADYAADAVISIGRNDSQTLYAVWEPMIYLNFENNTSETVSFELSPTSSGSLVLYVLNEVTGLYDRQEVNPSDLSVEPGETMHLALPYGEEQGIQISGTNTLGVGKRLIWDTSITDDDTGITYTSEDGTSTATTQYNQTSYTHSRNGSTCEHLLAHDSVDSSDAAQFSFEEKLLFNSYGLTVKFSEDDLEYALVLDDNYTGGGVQEYDYDSSDLSPNEQESLVLPSTSTRMGYQLLGWAYDPEATVPDFSATSPSGVPWTITDLYTFFNNNPSARPDGAWPRINDGETLQATLYAVWGINSDAGTVYIYKNVPEPGNQNMPFTFTLTISGTYTRNNNSQPLTASHDFTLSHGEYAVLKSSNNTVGGWIRTEVTTYKANGEVLASTQTYSIQASNPGNGGTWSPERITVTETAVQYYDTSITCSAQNTDRKLYIGSHATYETPAALDTAVSGNVAHWDSTDAGGTLVFSNQRQTRAVTVNKILHSRTAAPGMFSFTASYTVDGQTVNLPAEQITSGRPDSTWLANIPAGAQLTITEANDGSYETTMSAGNATDTDTSDQYAFTFTVTQDETVTFENTLKSYPVKFRLLDQNGSPLSGMFSLSTIGSSLYADPNNGGIFYQSNKFWVGEYTLGENIIPTGYIGLTDPATISVTGDATHPITTNSDMIYISEDPDVAGGYIVTVYNIVPSVDVTLTKKLNDPLLVQRTFTFTVGYTYVLRDSVTHEEMLTISKTDTYQIQATAAGASETIQVPGGATVTAAELLDTNQARIYDVTYAIDAGTAQPGTSWTDVVNQPVTVTFTNTRKVVNITVTKIVDPDTSADSFDFTALLQNGSAPVSGWTIASGYTTDANGYMSSGGTSGFQLTHNQSIVLQVPYASKLTITEAASSSYETSVAVDSGASSASQSITLTSAQTQEDLTVTFTNTMVTVAPTSRPMASSPYGLMLAVGLLFALCARPAYRREDERKEGER